MTPRKRPQASAVVVLAVAARSWAEHHPDGEPRPKAFLLGVRGYYRDTMGKVGINDRGIYDDALFVIEGQSVEGFNGNTDPSIHSPGIATLCTGWHPYKRGNHGISKPGGGYPAFRPATPGESLPVKRDGEIAFPSKRDGVAINIHKGGYKTTSSAGCQTIHPDQWWQFLNLAGGAMTRAGMKTIQYGLIEGPLV